MDSTNLVFKDGGSNNKHPLFSDEYFNFWKIRMKAPLEAQGEEICDVVQNGLVSNLCIEGRIRLVQGSNK